MSEWTLLRRLLDAVHQHSTLIGRIWLTVVAVFRVLVLAVAVEGVYEDERAMFSCDTLQPGCANVCYDAFAPISQPRFWVLHIVAVSTPSLLFILHAWHNPPSPRGRDPGGVSPGAARPPPRPGVLSTAYVVHVASRALLELAFLTLQWFLFGFRVPARFTCGAPPCPQRVHCYVSRPTEKSVFLVLMFGVGASCVLLNLLELGHLGRKRIKGLAQAEGAGPGGGGEEWAWPGGDGERPRPPKTQASKRSTEVWI